MPDKDGIEEVTQLMGMAADRVKTAFRLLDLAVERGEIPGGVALVGRKGHFVEYAAGYSFARGDRRIPAAVSTMYDCASLTKVVVTMPLVLMLLEQGLFRLDDPVAEFIPEFAANGKAAVTIRQLLTHTGGLVSYADMHSSGWTSEQIMEFVLGQTLRSEPGKQVVYSDMGFIVLGELISRLTGQPLQEAARQMLFEPLGMTASGYLPQSELKVRIAATEDKGDDGPRWGQVHDENAYAMGGVSGHAGLFSTARDLYRYAQMWLGEGRIEHVRVLSAAAVRAAIRSHTAALDSGNRGLGWALKGDRYDASGDLLSAASYGHTGFTGTSLYMDPESDLAVVLLTNRVHFGRDKSVVRLRATFHNTIAAAITEE